MDPAIQQEINNFPPEAKVSPDFIKFGLSVSDPDLLSPDPIRIQGFCDKKIKTNYSFKKLDIFFITNANLLIPRFP